MIKLAKFKMSDDDKNLIIGILICMLVGFIYLVTREEDHSLDWMTEEQYRDYMDELELYDIETYWR